MKRFNNLFNKIIDKENLRLAHFNARKGKSRYKEVIYVDNNLEKCIDELHSLLVNKTYTVGEYVMFTKNDKGKLRDIYKLGYYPDRIVHHAIMQIMEPIWKSRLINTTYQSIKGRGTIKCKQDVQKFIKFYQSELWVLKADIKKFYPSVSNTILKGIIRRKIKCLNTLWLLDTIIDSHKGLPIGNYISQYLGNIYLSYMDQEFKSNSGVLEYFRYCDDIVIFAKSKKNIRKVKAELKYYIEEVLKLRLKENVQYFSLQSRFLDFVGFVFLDNGSIRLRKSIARNIINSIKKNNTKSFPSYWGWIKQANAYSLWYAYIKEKKWK